MPSCGINAAMKGADQGRLRRPGLRRPTLSRAIAQASAVPRRDGQGDPTGSVDLVALGIDSKYALWEGVTKSSGSGESVRLLANPPEIPVFGSIV
jgi:hypothetical protein